MNSSLPLHRWLWADGVWIAKWMSMSMREEMPRPGNVANSKFNKYWLLLMFHISLLNSILPRALCQAVYSLWHCFLHLLGAILRGEVCGLRRKHGIKGDEHCRGYCGQRISQCVHQVAGQWGLEHGFCKEGLECDERQCQGSCLFHMRSSVGRLSVLHGK